MNKLDEGELFETQKQRDNLGTALSCLLTNPLHNASLRADPMLLRQCLKALQFESEATTIFYDFVMKTLREQGVIDGSCPGCHEMAIVAPPFIGDDMSTRRVCVNPDCDWRST